ncbi:hypothetical protein ACFZAV_45435 [Streptomyces sp. NPDC008343]|uniref:hypothetical protein n=1 Tax=Streptomyces sp. NPDC008343 TaxID=3364828 RepID=UPI0036EBAF6F
MEVWDAVNGEQVASFYVDDEVRAYAVAFSWLDGRPVVVAGTDSGKMFVFDLSRDEGDDSIHEPCSLDSGWKGGRVARRISAVVPRKRSDRLQLPANACQIGQACRRSRNSPSRSSRDPHLLTRADGEAVKVSLTRE